jgi:Cu(I)/Ag(I) efflux system membrane fusion protein
MEWVEPNNPAAIQVPALPGRIWEGKVDYIYPELDSETQTLRVRLRFPNADGALKPNMYAQAVIASRPKDDVLTIPREALIVSGGDERVVVALGDGRFQPKTVVPGMRAGDRLEILEGLQEGEAVVVSGQFLVDSESNLQASFRRMTAPEETPPSNHQH